MLQLLTGPWDVLTLSALLDVADPPVFVGLIGLAEGVPAEGLIIELLYGELAPFLPAVPLVVELGAPALLGPIVVGNLAGLVAFATRLNALRH